MLTARRAGCRCGAVESKAMARLHWLVALAAAGTAIAGTGCASGPKTTLGTVAETAPVVAVRDVKEKEGTITLRGTMVEKCSVAACWFRLKDDTGVVKVDLKAAGFTVTDVPTNATVVVTGIPVKGGDEVELAATGLRY
jgi:uncharacterized protein YdeI (BOF family)